MLHAALIVAGILAMQQPTDPRAEIVQRVSAISWLVGRWQGEGTMRTAQDGDPVPQRAEWTNEVVWGGTHLKMTFEAAYGEAFDRAYAFTCYLTWNPVDDRYESVWLSHTSHIMFTERGDYDTDTGALTLLATKQFTDAMPAQTVRSVFTREGDDRFSVIDHTLDEATGAWWESFSFRCVRAE
ncbi:MAG: DUF1579 family protein [Phycisphaerales bacterium]